MPAQKLEDLIVQQIAAIGKDRKLQAETLRQVRRLAREQTAALTAEEKQLRAQLDMAKAETSGLLNALAGGEVSGAAISDRLGELEQTTATVERRLAEVEQEKAAADQTNLDPDDLAGALSLFDPVWEVLFPAERERIIHLLIDQIEFNGQTNALAITFHPTGIKALAGEMAQEVAT